MEYHKKLKTDKLGNLGEMDKISKKKPKLSDFVI